MKWLNISKPLPLIVLATGFATTYYLQHTALQAASQSQQDNFAYQAREIMLRIEHRLDAYEQVLNGVRGLYSSSEKVNRHEFHNYISDLRLRSHYPGIQGVGFAPIIPLDKIVRHIGAIRKEGFPNYTLRPEGIRELYTPTIFIEPFTDRNLRAFGYDMYSEPVSRAAMEQARDLDQATITGKIRLVQETEQDVQAGFLMYEPVYKNGSPHETISERRANIIGWVYSPFRMYDLMKGILGEQADNVDLEIYDGEHITQETLMLDKDGDFVIQEDTSLYRSIQHIVTVGHTWTVKVRSLPTFEESIDTGRVIVIQTTGTLMSVLLSILVWLLVRGRTRAINLSQELSIAAAAFESQEGIMITDSKGVVLRVNPAFTETTGYSSEEIVGKTPRILKSGRHDATFYTSMWETINRTGSWQGEIWDRRKNGEIYPKWMTITAIKANNGTVTHYVGMQADITERKAAEDQIKNLAFYDPLTQLPNRRLLLDRLKQALASSVRTGREGAVLFIDLDNFKSLNDTLGHDIGDLLLQQVAQRLTSCLRDADTVARPSGDEFVARLGGDEFVVLLDNLSGHVLEAAAQTEVVGEKILAALNQPYQLTNHEYYNTPSIGVTLFRGHQQAIDELLKQADIAMYQAKKAGRNTLRFFDPQMQDSINARAALESELHRALEFQQFLLYYQIQVDSLHRPLGAEALIRWIHPERGLLPPLQFIPLAEETGLIQSIGQWVLEAACAQIKTWQQEELTRDLVLAVNVSAKQFRQAGFVSQVQAVIQRHAINPTLLKLELTESLLLENIEDTLINMNALNEIGVKLSLDDFGTGYSSLQYLRKLPLDQIKIDRAFISDITTNTNDEKIVYTIIAMAKSLGFDVIAEGVETEEQRQLLLKNGCTHYQGYLFSKPIPIGQFELLLNQG